MAYFKKTNLSEIAQQGAFMVYFYDPYNRNVSNKVIPVNSFQEFCEICPDPISAIHSFSENNVTMGEKGDFMTQWPNSIIIEHEGNCIDFSIFMHYYFNSHDIENAIGFVTFIDEMYGYRQTGHAYPIFKMHNLYWIWNYFGNSPDEFDINGPFSSLDAVNAQASEYYAVLFNSLLKAPDLRTLKPKKAFGIYLEEDELEFLDKEYGRRITHSDLLQQSPKIRKLINDADKATSKYRTSTIDIHEVQFNIAPLLPSEYSIKEFFKAFKMASFKKGLRSNVNTFWGR